MHVLSVITMVTLKLGMIQVELDDETKRLSDVRPFQPMLKLVEKTIITGPREERVIQAQLSVLLGKREYQLNELIVIMNA